jgi:hypothetical protein
MQYVGTSVCAVPLSVLEQHSSCRGSIIQLLDGLCSSDMDASGFDCNIGAAFLGTIEHKECGRRWCMQGSAGRVACRSDWQHGSKPSHRCSVNFAGMAAMQHASDSATSQHPTESNETVEQHTSLQPFHHHVQLQTMYSSTTTTGQARVPKQHSTQLTGMTRIERNICAISIRTRWQHNTQYNHG